MAEVLKAQCECLPSAVGAEVGVSNGTIYLDQTMVSQVNSYVKVLSELEWPGMRGNLSTAKDTASRMQYRSFPITGSLNSMTSNIDDNVEKLEQFTLEFADYDNNVTAFELQNAVRFEYVMNKEFNYEDAQKLIEWTDITGLGLDIAAITARVIFKIPKTIITSGQYTYFSGFAKGMYSGRYLTSNLLNGKYPAASNAFKLNTAMKVANWAMIGVSAAYSGYQEYNRNPYIATERKVINTTVAVVTDVGAALAGAKIGAAVGTLIPIPVVGTVVGAVVGAAVGVGVNWIASQDWFGGKSLKTLAADGLNAAWDGIKTGASAVADGVKSVWGWLTGKKATGTLQPANP
jgi:hypothetical protein